MDRRALPAPKEKKGFLQRIKEGYEDQKGKSQSLVPISKPQEIITPEILPPEHPPLRFPQEQLYDDGRIDADLMRFEIWCAVTGKPQVGVSEIHGKDAFLFASEIPTHRARPTVIGYKEYSIDVSSDWKCLWCGAQEGKQDFLGSLWECTEPNCGKGVLHCSGSSHGKFRCACGQRAPRAFGRSDFFHVYIYDGVRGPSGRGYTQTRMRPDGSISYSFYQGASNGSLVSSNKWLRKLPK